MKPQVKPLKLCRNFEVADLNRSLSDSTACLGGHLHSLTDTTPWLSVNPRCRDTSRPSGAEYAATIATAALRAGSPLQAGESLRSRHRPYRLCRPRLRIVSHLPNSPKYDKPKVFTTVLRQCIEAATSGEMKADTCTACSPLECGAPVMSRVPRDPQLPSLAAFECMTWRLCRHV